MTGKTMKCRHLCMLMYVDMDFNLVQVLMFVVYQYMYIKLFFFCNYFMFTLFCAHNWFVFDANFNYPDNLDWLFFKYHKILAGCLHVQKFQEMQRNKEINCSGFQNSLRCMYSVDHFFESRTYFLLTIRARVFTREYWPKVAAV